jgi:hypothetical protein
MAGAITGAESSWKKFRRFLLRLACAPLVTRKGIEPPTLGLDYYAAPTLLAWTHHVGFTINRCTTAGLQLLGTEQAMRRSGQSSCGAQLTLRSTGEEWVCWARLFLPTGATSPSVIRPRRITLLDYFSGTEKLTLQDRR